MSWGPAFMYYHCPECGKRFKCAVELIPVLGERFGRCPDCGAEGILDKDGAVTPDDFLYPEIEE